MTTTSTTPATGRIRLSPRGRLIAMTAGHAVDDVYQGAVPALLTFLVADRH